MANRSIRGRRWRKELALEKSDIPSASYEGDEDESMNGMRASTAR